MKKFMLAVLLFALSATLCAASYLPGFAPARYVTVPVTTSVPRNPVVLTNLVWAQIDKIHIKYRTADTTPEYLMFFAGATIPNPTGNASPWFGLKGTTPSSGGFDYFVATLTPGDAYARDGVTVHDITFECTAQTSYAAAYPVFGGVWGTRDNSATVDWYEVDIYDSEGQALARLRPGTITVIIDQTAVEVAGFCDSVSGLFFERASSSKPAFAASEEKLCFLTVSSAHAPDTYGTLSPSLGEHEYATNVSPITVSVSPTVFEDSVSAYAGSVAGTRMRTCAKCTIVGLATNEYPTNSVDVVPGDSRSIEAVWSFSGKEYKIAAAVYQGIGGNVAIGGGTAQTSVSNWIADAGTVNVTATPDAGYEFKYWIGDSEGIDTSSATLSFTCDRPRALTVVFAKTSGGDTVSWTGATDGNWSDAVNWAPHAPTVGDNVTIDSLVTVTLDTSTPLLSSLTIGGTKAAVLKMRNWSTCVRAAAVTVADLGKITCDGPIYKGGVSNRVWVAADTLSVAGLGKIDADQKGYAVTNGPCWVKSIFRNSSLADILKYAGGAYGGRQGYDSMLYKDIGGYFRTYPMPEPYGNAAAPLDPGSGAGLSGSTYSYPGGGAIRLEVSGALTVSGTVTANGGSIRSGSCGGATGGGVYVTCRTVSGSGAITANGGGYIGSTTPGGGSGGRVAVIYDANAQTSAACNVRFEARAGCNHLNNRASGIVEPGTLYFTDNRFLSAPEYLASGWKFAGRWMSAAGAPTNLTVNGDLKIAGSQLSFAEAPFTLDVSGSLSVTGNMDYADISWFSNATVSVGGDMKIDSARLDLYGGSWDVTGNMLLNTNATTRKGAELVARAAATNGIDEAYGATVDVGGQLTLGNNALVSPYCEWKKGAVVNFTVGDLVVDAGAQFNANEKGYRSGYGPGRPISNTDNVGSSYGGRGGSIANPGSRVAPYGTADNPVFPGSGSGNNGSDSGRAWSGGGAVLVTASRTMTLNGAVSANGNASEQFWYPGASGGSVFLKTPILNPSTGQVTARGGMRNSWDKGSYGGGGRIAIGTRQNKAPSLTIDVSSLSAEYAEAGTIHPFTLPPQPDTFTVSATPSEVGESAISPAYGDNLALAAGTEILCTASGEQIDMGAGAVGFIRGWKLYQCDSSDTRTLVDEAVTNAYRYVHTAGAIYRLEWQIERAFPVTLIMNEPAGADVYAGAQALQAGVNYVIESDAVTFSAVTKAGYTFFAWSGSDFEDTRETAVTLPVHAARTLSLIILNDNHVAAEVAWSGAAGGKWTDIANWAGGAFPQAGDAVTITAGNSQSITLGLTPPDLASFSIGNTGGGTTKLRLSNWSTCVRANAITVNNGGVICVEDAFTDEQMSNRVWLAGQTLTVNAGGKILADQAGYAKRNGPAWVGATEIAHQICNSARIEFGGAYGGEQGYPTDDGRDWALIPPHSYGSAEAPLDPGSGGGESAGGGAIRLDFTGDVVINGLISAAGQTLNTGGPGSGGAVYINCRTVSGSGEVKANGRDATLTTSTSNYGGSGGRVAVIYDTDAQDSVECSVRFEARGGVAYTFAGDAVNGSVSAFIPDVLAEDGTLYFPDSLFLTGGGYRANGLKFAGKWMAPGVGATLDFGAAPLVLDRTHLVFTNGVSVIAGGDVTMTGLGPRPAENGVLLTNGNFTVGGNLTLKDARVELRGGDLTVGGDLVQEINTALYTDNDYLASKTGGGELCFRPAPTNGTGKAFGAKLAVGGNWIMREGSATYPFTHPTDGAIVEMTARNFTLDANAYVKADMRGYERGYGPGRKDPKTSYIGASHGGKGSWGQSDPNLEARVAPRYGDEKFPRTPGTGGWGDMSSRYGHTAVPGGGVVYITATSDMTLNGYIGACGTASAFFAYYTAGSSGGSICLKARKLKDGTPTVIAQGGRGNKVNDGGGIGGGGRVAVWCNKFLPADEIAYKARFTAPRGLLGTGSVNTAEDGTVYWGTLPDTGTLILLK